MTEVNVVTRSGLASGSGTRALAHGGLMALVLVVMMTLVGAPFAAAAKSPWSIEQSPNDGTDPNYLVATSCVSSTFCMAVGHYSDPAGDDQTLIESWNGTSWVLLPSPDAGSAANDLTGVSCISTVSCWAVGYDGQGSAVDQTLVESWNGAVWSIMPSPNSGSGSGLNGVTCLPGGSCVAVGYGTLESGVAQTLVETRNGSGWSIVASPDVGTNGNFLNSVSCTALNSCMAVGQYATTGGFPELTLAERWNGTSWSVVDTKNRDMTESNSLDSVSCAGPQFCMAVGEYPNTHHSASTLAELWNGSSWTVVSSQNEAKSNYLYGVSCWASQKCLAVGRGAQSGSQAQTMIERWNGTAWGLVASPASGDTSTLAGVVCLSGSSCHAVGFSLNSSTARTLVEAGGS
jgi:hypothetical protein